MDNFLLFFSMSGGEILLIVIAIYLVFGPKKIPEFARMVGRGINELRRATDDIKKEIKRETSDIKKDVNVDLGIDLKDPLDINSEKDSYKTSTNKKPGKEQPGKSESSPERKKTTKPENKDNNDPDTK